MLEKGVINMYHYAYFGGFPFFIFGGIINLVFWVLIFTLIFKLIKSFSGEHVSDKELDEDDPSSAVSILKRRYAKGEIAKKEFDQMKKDIA